MNAIKDFFMGAPWQTILMVFTFKVIEVTLSTVRLIIVSKGYKLPGALVSFFEVLIWVFTASSVVKDVKSAPILAITYALGYAVGVFVGGVIEKKLAFGKVMLHLIVPVESSTKLTEYIRAKKIGVTSISAKGMNGDKVLLVLYANRRHIDNLRKEIIDIEPVSFIGISDVVNISGGIIPKRRRIVK